jgi:hypothetical protein
MSFVFPRVSVVVVFLPSQRVSFVYRGLRIVIRDDAAAN